MNTIKTTLVFPQRLWVSFQNITGKKKSSEAVSRMLSYAVRQYHAEELLHARPNPDWDDRYLKAAARKEIEDQKKLLSLSR